MTAYTAAFGACMEIPPEKFLAESFSRGPGTLPVTLRVLVTGSRTWKHASVIMSALDTVKAAARTQRRMMIVVHGDCPSGADNIAKVWAIRNGAHDEELTGIVEEPHKAQWHLGRRAGLDRNIEMVRHGADVCLAFIADNSSGASHCARHAAEAGIPVLKWTVTDGSLDPGGPVRLK